MIPKPTNRIEYADLAALIGNVREGKTIEYKQELPARSGDEKIKFLKVVSSFANTSGGDLIVGMMADNGLAKELRGLPLSDSDDYKLRLEQLLATCIEPRLPRYEFHVVPCSAESYMLVLRVHRSWLSPHRVTNDNKFYGRNSGGCYALDVRELRTAFLLSETIAERIRAFSIERTAKIAAGDAPVTLLAGGSLVLHIVPFSAFDVGSSFPLDEVAADPNKFPTFGDRIAPRSQITFDGLLTTSNLDAPPKPQRAYVQIFRTGIVESVYSSLANRGVWLIAPNIEAMIIRHAWLYTASLGSFGVEPPMAILASLVNVKGKRLLQDFAVRALPEDLPSVVLSHDQYHFTEAIFETVPTDDNTAARQLRATLNHLANTSGLAGSQYFDASGNYTLKI
jgi:hypothetical protein